MKWCSTFRKQILKSVKTRSKVFFCCYFPHFLFEMSLMYPLPHHHFLLTILLFCFKRKNIVISHHKLKECTLRQTCMFLFLFYNCRKAVLDSWDRLVSMWDRRALQIVFLADILTDWLQKQTSSTISIPPLLPLAAKPIGNVGIVEHSSVTSWMTDITSENCLVSMRQKQQTASQ